MRIVHRVGVQDSAAHMVDVEMRVSSDVPLPSPLVVTMAVWTPGSYLVREYSRHVEAVSADTLSAQKTAKNTWSVAHDSAQEITVRYRVYCNDLTVRTNHADATHVYLNGAPTFLAVAGHEGAYEIEIDAPMAWRVATPLPAIHGRRNAFRAADYDELVDSPIECGEHDEHPFEAAGQKHRYDVWPKGALSTTHAENLMRDTRMIVDTEAKLLGGGLPHDGYTFILHLSSRGRGGLEHNASSTLIAPATAPHTREGWLDLLSLVAHEYFHLWNVKRIRPAGLFPYRYDRENYTRLLWWFEGGTSYFDWRVLRLAGLCTEEEYLDHLAAEVAYVEQTPGRNAHALEEASFDAWIKLYRPDENSSNSTISYYRKGEIVNAMMDVEVRARSDGKSSLDAILLALWQRYGSKGVPVPEDGMQSIFEDVSGCALGDLFDAWVRGRRDLDYSTFARVGLSLERVTKGTAAISARLSSSAGRVGVSSVARGGAAHRAGVDPGDELISIDGRRVDSTSLDSALAGKNAGDRVEVIVSRDGRTHTLSLDLDGARLDKVRLVPNKDATPEQIALRAAWLQT